MEVKVQGTCLLACLWLKECGLNKIEYIIYIFNCLGLLHSRFYFGCLSLLICKRGLKFIPYFQKDACRM